MSPRPQCDVILKHTYGELYVTAGQNKLRLFTRGLCGSFPIWCAFIPWITNSPLPINLERVQNLCCGGPGSQTMLGGGKTSWEKPNGSLWSRKILENQRNGTGKETCCMNTTLNTFFFFISQSPIVISCGVCIPSKLVKKKARIGLGGVNIQIKRNWELSFQRNIYTSHN